nr:hypothetical protein [Tanacetum cinerariifolium]
MKDKGVSNNSQLRDKKIQVEDHHMISSISNKTKSVTACNDSLKSRTSNVNVVCATCGKCLIDSNHFAYVTKILHDVNARTKKPNVVPISTRKPKTCVQHMRRKSEQLLSEQLEKIRFLLQLLGLKQLGKEMYTEFKKIMHMKFQMSSLGELTFFLGLQTASIPMETSKPLMKDENAEDIDVHLYRLMIGSLMYLTSSRTDIMFVVCACARFQVTPTASHLHAVKVSHLDNGRNSGMQHNDQS